MEATNKLKFPPRKKLKSSKLTSLDSRTLVNAEQLGRKYPSITPTGFYSDILGSGALSVLGNVQEGPNVIRHLLNQSGQEHYTPEVSAFLGPENIGTHLESQVYGSDTELHTRTDFTLRSFQPKVQIPFQVAPGQRPRKLEIERRRRQYQSQNLKQLLKYEGINSDKLIPRHSGPEKNRAKSGKNPAHFTVYLPLEVFDDEEFESRTPNEWLELGYEEGSNDRKPIPGNALLPKEDKLGHDDPKSDSLGYRWFFVGVLDYDKERKLYLVQKANSYGLIRDEKNRIVVNGGITETGERLELPNQFWIPRVQLMFSAEDPVVFSKRVAYAHYLRQKTEALLLYNLYIDCMPVDGLRFLDRKSLKNMKKWAFSTPGFRDKYALPEYFRRIEQEVHLDYNRTMNKITFDNVVISDPKQFSYVTLPDEKKIKVPSRGLVQIPDYPFHQTKKAFFFNTLLTKPEVILALCKVRAECNKVAAMSLFFVTFIKSVRLEEFEQIQSQAHAQIQLFLSDSWINTLKKVLRSSLWDVRKGWFNLRESNWEVYRTSKLHMLMEMIKYNLQDSLRYLVQDSLVNYTQMILDGCYSSLNCLKDMKWGGDLINSNFKPRKMPIFVMDLSLDNGRVQFNTPLERFKAVTLTLFDKAITATQHVPHIEKFVLEEMFQSATPLLESVWHNEPPVQELRNTIKNAMDKALIPLRSYAKEYEKFLELNELNIDNYVNTFSIQEPLVHDVKHEVELHLKKKTHIERTIPSSIIIGPFVVNVEALRTNLAKKCHGLAHAVLQMFAKRLHNQVEEINDDFKMINRKLFEKANTIEDLTDHREWMKKVPEMLKTNEEITNKLMVEYDIFDEFLFNLTDEDFQDKWSAIASPHLITSRMETIKLQHLEEEEHFRKIQISDQSALQEKLEGLQIIVAGFAAYTDMSRAHETANEVRRIHKQLVESQNQAQLYNSRERLFEMPVTNYDRLYKMVKEFQPYRDLWTTTSDWLRWHESWMNDPLHTIDAEQIERNVIDAYKTVHRCTKFFKDIPGLSEVAARIRFMIEDFKPYIPLIQALRNPGMRNRHWENLSEQIQISIKPKANLTFARCLDMHLQDHIEAIAKVAEVAGKEYAIEQALDKMEGDWENISFDVMPYKETGTFILKSPDEASQLLDDHIVMTQSMAFSPFKKAYESRISSWENKLRMTQDVLEEWLQCQRSWIYLEPIFSSDDINRQLPVESKRYHTMERLWITIMKNANENRKIIDLCPDGRLLENLRECNKQLDLVQKGLSEYLETKRCSFPRFYFLSDDELLEILSQTKDPTAVQPHLRKCFENVAHLHFQEDLHITHMYSAEGEEIKLFKTIYPTGNVEDWLLEVEKMMKASVKDNIQRSLKTYPETLRAEWVLTWPGQVVIAGCQTFWTMEVAEALRTGELKSKLFPKLAGQLNDLVALVRGRLTRMQRTILSALIVIEVHAKDVVANLLEEHVQSEHDFEWISQLRYYWARDDLRVCAVNAEFLYGYEYLGNTGRLVITPLTDRCYLTLTGALHLKFGGAPAGPAGTGKTETTKDLGKALAIQTVVFNCSDQLDFIAMGKFFKGLASSGAWACFDEFNRIDIEVLSVVAQQITTIQKAQQQRAERFMFEGIEIPLIPSCAVFITMNPGYAGRTELPDNLKALFRPVAMMVPDYAMIAEISLYSFGFSNAKVLAKKITTTFKLSSEQLSSQDHYDFGMRAVKTVISAAGNLKRENPDVDEELICLRAIRDVNVPKFLQDDLKLFNGIVSDLFPKIKEEAVDYGILEQSIRKTCGKKSLKDVNDFVTKCIQLFETTVVRHGLMLVGPSGSGKTKCYEVLAEALTALKGKKSVSGEKYEKVSVFILNPKSITMGQLYGEFDVLTHEWTDGILSSLIRIGAAATDQVKKWYMFDGPVDAVWIENMNTVLDDNKKLCLSSGEIIKLSEAMTMMFEVEDLAVASPATVSRCGMVYLEPSILGLEPFIECWLNKVPPSIEPYKTNLQFLFNSFLEESISLVRKSVKEVITSVDSNLTFSLLKVMDCFFQPLVPKEGTRGYPLEKLSLLDDLIEPWFIFSLVWSVGCTGDAASYAIFNNWLRQKMVQEKMTLLFPDVGLVYDYQLDDAGFSNTSHDEEEIERKVQWVDWMVSAPEIEITPETNYSDIIVPTQDTIRMSQLLSMLLNNKKPVLCIGPTGTGKTIVISDKLLKKMHPDYISHFLIFSARTSANQTQDFIDSKLDKRRKGVYGPPLGKYFVFFIDDLNMPALETYGAQPPIEILRQWMDHKGWYDRKLIGRFKQLMDINFICAMGPPGGGRNQITARFSRHFNYLSFIEMNDNSKVKIFSTILNSWLTNAEEVNNLNMPLVIATIEVYSTIISQLLPTPAKSHYTFNLRDLSKVFQGILMAESASTQSKVLLLRLWYHESCRVFKDRLVNDNDRKWFENLMRTKLVELGTSFEHVAPHLPVLYGDFLAIGTDNKIYEFIADHDKMVNVIEEYMDDFNQTNTNKLKLILFMDAIQHICRVSRILRQPMGNALLLGVGGSGRQSLTKLAAHMAEYDCFQIELAKNYGTSEWREDIKRILMKAGVQYQHIAFLFVDTQIKEESFLEDVNNILNSGDVPNIYNFDEQEVIFTAMKPVVQDLGQQPTKANMMATYTKRVRNNIHTVLCMSPIGEVFRARLRQFPSLVTCSTIDWFSEWPTEALQSVATALLEEIPELEAGPVIMKALVEMCVSIHQTVAVKSLQYMRELSRYNYITPKSYLDLLSLFSVLISIKIQTLTTDKNRMKQGLDKLLRTAEDVSKMQEELESMRPLLEEAAHDTVTTMEKIKTDTAIAEETRKAVSEEEAKASEKANVAQAIADDAQKDLDEALPALEAALASLKSLNKNDVTEVRGMQRPPLGVKLVMETVCIMKGIKPKKVAGERPGSKIDDYWEPGKGLLQDPAKFLDSLFKYDKDNIPDSIIKAIQPYIDSDDFTPATIAKVSKACTSICQWVRAMYKYHFIARAVEPKRQALHEAQEDLAVTQKILEKAKNQLEEVELGIAALESKYKDCVAKKVELENKCDQCEQRLIRADKLINGLSDEKIRWQETVQNLNNMIINVAGDVLISGGFVAYLGPFTGEYRAAMNDEWLQKLLALGVPHTKECSLTSTLGDPVNIRTWQISGLPKDALSVENGIIMKYSQRWPLFIDPQGQANKWIKNLERDQGLDIFKMSDRDFLRSLENAIRFGKPCLLENVREELDPALEPILLKMTYKQQGSTVIKLGDAVIPYHDDFKMYITSKLPNPHYTPEISTKVTLINFTLSPSGLEDQLLGRVVAQERPDLEDAKNQLIISNAKMRSELKEIEDQILLRLSTSEGNPVDDVELIKVLEASKIKAGEIKMKVTIAEQTEKDIDITRLQYVPVAERTQILFFCVSDLSNVDPMYQYSLEWFLTIFMAGIVNSERADTVEKRIKLINNYFTYSLYLNVCRSLFEKHKLMYAFLVCVRIMMNDDRIDMDEWRYLLTGASTQMLSPNPASEWLSDRAWKDIQSLTTLQSFSNFLEDFVQNLKGFQIIFDSPDPHRHPFPGTLDARLNSFQKLLVMRCLRVDKVTNAMQDFVSLHLGQKFIEPQTSDLHSVFKDSAPSIPLIFVLSPGTDPAADLYKFAEEMKFSKKMSSISLGQGQGPRAEAMMHNSMERGKWVFFQNCHLAPSWMPSLERLVETVDPDKVHRDFRVWLTSLPSSTFPVSILQNGSKMTIEPPRGIKANLMKTYTNFSDDFLNSCTKLSEFKSLLFSLCLFHGSIIERRKFGPLGFNIPYEFTDGDLRICISQLKMFLDEYTELPYKVLKYTAGEINYGGRVTDDWDRRCIMNILEDFYSKDILEDGHLYSESGIYKQISTETDLEGYLDYIKRLPINDTPEIFGLHDNANITFAQNETFVLLNCLLLLQPKTSAAGGKGVEEIVEEMCGNILENIPDLIDIKAVLEEFPVRYEESMNTVLVQEVIRYNRLLETIVQSLNGLVNALKGLVVMSSQLELMADSLFHNIVPELWNAKAYPSLKPLASWVNDLLERIDFLQKWITNGIPAAFWISGFFFPQAFLTGTLQNFARRSIISIDIITFDFTIIENDHHELIRPRFGCYIYGLFLEGACWDGALARLSESRPKELYTDMAVIWLIPTANRKPPKEIYYCPIYKTLQRAGTLSTTGHSTNYVIAVELPTTKPHQHWIKRGVALICALDY
ncbi:dynein axonemal heavy chain 1 [Rhinoraja longicauda]